MPSKFAKKYYRGVDGTRALCAAHWKGFPERVSPVNEPIVWMGAQGRPPRLPGLASPGPLDSLAAEGERIWPAHRAAVGHGLEGDGPTHRVLTATREFVGVRGCGEADCACWRKAFAGGVGQHDPRLPWSGMPPPWTGVVAPMRNPKDGLGPQGTPYGLHYPPLLTGPFSWPCRPLLSPYPLA